jgi:hypothetical protein
MLSLDRMRNLLWITLLATGCDGKSETIGPPLSIDLAQVTLQPAQDQVFCQYLPPDGHARWIDRFTIDLGTGSHHLVVFRRKDDQHDAAFGPVACDQLDLPDGIDGMLPGSQQPHSELQLPDGVAMRMDADHGLFFQFHFIDASQQPLVTKVHWEAHTIDPSLVKQQAAMLFYSQWNLKVPPGASTQSDSCPAPRDLHLLMATGHMHRHGLSFDARAGEQSIYHTDSWDSPGGIQFDGAGMAIARNTPITWSCDYENDTGAELDFGPSSTMNEMCILAGIFYPSDGETDFGTGCSN